MTEILGPHIKAVALDWDDNVVGTLKAKSAQHKHVARTHYEKELTDEEIREHWGKPLDVLVAQFYGTDDIDTAMAHILDCHADFPKELFAESPRVLAALKAAGLAVAVVTATSRTSIEVDFSHMGIEQYIDYVQTHEDTDFHKPDPRVFEPTIAWLGSVGIRPDETIYLGDGLHDMHAALGAGFEFVGTCRGLVLPEEFEEAGVRHIPHIGHLTD